MLFNSLDFAIFLPLVFALYWSPLFKDRRAQNFLIAIASYVFYGWWDWRFLSLIFLSTILDFFVGRKLLAADKKSTRKALLYVSLVFNLGLLGFFKYYNFFVESFVDAFTLFGVSMTPSTLNIILPVGISFYTFQTLSYTIDVYRGNLKPTDDFVSFMAFVSFFPQLVAGPIERATNLLPQFYKKREFDYSGAVDGCRQILWGLFKKVVIADGAAEFANQIFNSSADMNGSTLFLGAIFFTFQIYGDFSGYSDIALGTSRLFGFKLMRNFAYPYFSRDIAEFWRRWHISLSTWFRDYLYIPLGGSKGGNSMRIRNTFIIFLVSGFWHGANWTFIVWGGLNALYFLPVMLSGRNRRNLEVVAQNTMLPSFRELVSMLTTFFLTIIAWVFFRAENVQHALEYLQGMFSSSLFELPQYSNWRKSFEVLVLIGIFLLVEWRGRKEQYAIEKWMFNSSKWLRRAVYLLIAFVIMLYVGKEEAFIYFQF